jgi:hypothetical protein
LVALTGGTAVSTDGAKDRDLDDLHPLREAVFEASEDEEQGRARVRGSSPPPETESPVTPREAPRRKEPKKRRGEKEASPLLAKLAAASPYNVMLVVSAAALFIGILSMFLELTSYGWSISAKP